MARTVSVGYSVAREDRIAVSSIECQSGEEEVVFESFNPDDVPSLEAWVRGADIGVTVYFQADREGVLQDCGLPSDSLNETATTYAIVQWVCPATSIRGSGEKILLQNGENIATCRIPGDQISHSVKISLDLVLGKNPRPDESTTAPVAPGSYLWRDDFRLLLEGIGPTFPTLEVSLKEENHRFAYDQWQVRFEEDLDLHISRGCQVVLNTSHPDTRKAMNEISAGKPSYSSKLWKSFLDVDVRRQLLIFAIGKAAEYDLKSYSEDDESLGNLLHETLMLYFPSEDHSKLASLILNDPQSVSSKVQSLLFDSEREDTES